MRSVICALALLALPTSALADDFNILRGTVPTTNWGGLYGGVQGGYSSSNMNFSNGVGPLVANILRSSSLSNDVSDWAVLGTASNGTTSYGGFIGYNTVWDDAVLGFEVNYNRVRFEGISTSSISRIFTDNTAAPPNTTYQYDVTVAGSSSIRMTDIATLRARAGWSVGQFLPYAFGGFAIGRADVAQSASVTGTRTDTVTNPVTGSTSTSAPGPVDLPGAQTNAQQGEFAYGWVAGLGMDVALFSHAFARAEWEYVGFAPINGIRVNSNSIRGGVGLKF
jgi:outer membrane immunogenic protein